MDALHGIVTEVVQKHDIPAVSVGFIHQGQVMSYLSLGAQVRGGAPVDEASIYQIASLSKLLTGITVRQLILQERLAVDGYVADYLDGDLTDEAVTNLSGITVSDLLQHRSGIQDTDCALYRDRLDGEPWLDGYDRAALIADLNNLPPQSSGTTSFSYSSCGYAVLGLVAENVGQTRFAQLLQREVAMRFGMTQTFVTPDASQQEALVTPYRKTDRFAVTAPSILGMATSGSGIYSTVRDLTRLQEQQLATYRDQGNASRPLMLTGETGEGPDPSMRFGAGLIQVEMPMGQLFVHDGDADGFAAVYAFLPEHNVGTVLLTSSGGAWVQDTAMAILNTLVSEID